MGCRHRYGTRHLSFLRKSFAQQGSTEAHWFFYYDNQNRLVEIKHTPNISSPTTYSIFQFYWIGRRPIAYWQQDFPSTNLSRRYVHADAQSKALEVWSWPTTGPAVVQWRLDPDFFGWDAIWFGWSVYQPFRGVAAGEYIDEETLAYDDSINALRPPLHSRFGGYYDPLTATRLQAYERSAVDSYAARSSINQYVDSSGTSGTMNFGGFGGGSSVDCYDFEWTHEVTECLGIGNDEFGGGGGGGGGEASGRYRIGIYVNCNTEMVQNCSPFNSLVSDCVLARCRKSFCTDFFWTGRDCTIGECQVAKAQKEWYDALECDDVLWAVVCIRGRPTGPPPVYTADPPESCYVPRRPPTGIGNEPGPGSVCRR